MADDSVHEVQLNGKQLVFLFMVGTVIAVVIFLCGVLVGRGLRPATPAIDLASADGVIAADPTTAAIDPTEPAASASTTPSDGTPVSARESLTYPERLESPAPLPDDLREPVPTPPAPKPASKPAPKPATPAKVLEPAADASLAEPPGRGLVVQVMAVNTRAEAETIAKRLRGKGYPAFVTTTGTASKTTYRVRVGKYDTQPEADAVATRLQKEEQFKPWVIR